MTTLAHLAAEQAVKVGMVAHTRVGVSADVGVAAEVTWPTTASGRIPRANSMAGAEVVGIRFAMLRRWDSTICEQNGCLTQRGPVEGNDTEAFLAPNAEKGSRNA